MFAMLGVVDNVFEPGSTIGLFEVRTPEAITYKLGDGQATPDEFSLEFRRDPPSDALEGGAFGVGFVGMLPGLATVRDGEVTLDDLRLIGMSTGSAIIFKAPGASGPAWLDAFPEGYSCGFCLRELQPEEFAPVDCTFVEIEFPFTNPCLW